MNRLKEEFMLPTQRDRAQRRKNKRINSTHRIDYSTGPIEFSRVSKTLSVGGIFITTTHTLPVDTKIYMRIQFDQQGEEYINVEGVVRYVQPKRGMGVKFINLREEDRKLIETRVDNYWWQEA
jgi:c-di-GMP-binding flagellar brake protein YcgR